MADEVAVLVQQGTALLVGEVVGDYEFAPRDDVGTRHRRRVRWDRLVPRSAVAPPSALQDVRPLFAVQLALAPEVRAARLTDATGVSRTQVGDTGAPTRQRRPERTREHGRLRRRDRPGHDQHPVHGLRPRRATRSPGTSSSTSRSCRAPAGSSTTRSRSGSAPAPSIADRAARQPACAPATSPRSASPTSARPRWCGTADRPALLQRHRLAGHPHRPHRRAPWTADGRGDVIRARTGLPPATYFSGGKLQWILENVDGVREAAERGDAVFGTIDSWLLWNLTGGVDGGVHVTDVTNASRTMLMDLETLDWDDELLAFFGVPRAMLPADPPVLGPRAATA